MSKHNTTLPSDGGDGQTAARMESPPVRWRDEAPESEGWALQWDTTALRRANLARQMRELREASGNQ